MKITLHFIQVICVIFILGIAVKAQEETWLNRGELPLSQPQWSPAGHLISVAGDGEILLFTPEFVLVDRLPIMDEPSDGLILNYAWSPDGTMLAIGIYMDVDFDQLQLWDVQARQRVALNQSEGNIIIAWSPDSQYIASNGIAGNSRVIDIYDREGNQVYFWDINGFNFAWSPTGEQMAVMTTQETSLWDVSSFPPQRITTLPQGSFDNGIAYNADGSQIAYTVVPEGYISIFDTTTYQKLHSTEGIRNIQSIIWNLSPLTVVAYRETKIWNAESWQLEMTLADNYLDGFSWSPDNTRFVASSEADGIHIRDASTGAVLARLAAR